MMPLLACRDHTERIKVLEGQLVLLSKNIDGTLDLVKKVVDMSTAQPPGPDPDLPGYFGNRCPV
jgi:hypothetical protein